MRIKHALSGPFAFRFLVSKRSPLGYLGVLCLLLLGFSTIPPGVPGIDQPTPIGPYLNGAFPSESPTGNNDSWVVENAFPNLTFADPVALLEVPDLPSYYVVTKPGVIYQIDNNENAAVKQPVLDIRQRVDTEEDAGMLNAVLHPEFGQAGSPNRGYIYVMYRYHPNGNVPGCNYGFIRLSRFTRPDGATSFDPNSEFVLVQVFDKLCQHHGSGMFFDEQGYFYFTIGDGAEENGTKEYRTAQKRDGRLLSGLFRIDLDKDPSRSHPIRRFQIDPPELAFPNDSSFSQGYYIPNDNPWLDANGGLLEEYYAIGLRSPHRATRDAVTGNIYIGDVGEGFREEVSIATKGSNMQWPYMEGTVPGIKGPPAEIVGISTPPIFDYGRASGNAVIGGFVYRGSKFQTSLAGRYIFGDHGLRNIWALDPASGEVNYLLTVPAFGVGSKNGISSFATNSAGDIFVLKLYGVDQDGGLIYKLKRSSAVPDPPARLSQTGAFSDLASLSPAPGLVPYDVNAPLWSDRAVKSRWIALPNNGTHNQPDEQITFSATGKWQFPAGTVFVKHFELPTDYSRPWITRRLETRFLVITEDGGAYGVTYKWREDGTDADLLAAGESVDIPILNGPAATQRWDFPGRTDCMTCHNSNAEFVLGVTTWQLNGDLTYPSGIADNQLNTWNHLQMFANDFAPEDIPGFLQSSNIADETASPESRVRSYLDANCAHCHRPGGVEGAFDARFSTPLDAQHIVNTFGVSRNTPADHLIVKPRDTSLSELWLRDGALGLNAMPPLAKNLVDEQYMNVLTEWINGLDSEACAPVALAGLPWSAPSQNGVGPVEINTSNGEGPAGDGKPITINERVFPNGLGVHAYSSLTYKLNGDYAAFETFIGVDDETDAACNVASVQFLIYLDGNLAYQSPVMKEFDDARFVKLDVTGVQEMRLVVTDAGDGDVCDHADWANPVLKPCGECAEGVGTACDDGDPCTINDQLNESCKCAGTLIDSDGDGVCDSDDICPGSDDKLDVDLDGIPDGCDNEFCPLTYLSDLNWVGAPINGSGPVRRDASNGNNPLSINGQTFEKGLGVHALSELTYHIGELGFETFRAVIGIDDECYEAGSVIFQVYTDGELVYQSQVLTYQSAAVPIAVPLSDVNELKLRVTTAGDGTSCDHADWAMARLERCCTMAQQNGGACDDGDPCTINDHYTADCNCVGTYQDMDTDGDGVCDGMDICPGADDMADADGDGVPDACDQCHGADDRLDSDQDGVPDACDQCPGHDDGKDRDQDGVPNACDICDGSPDQVDTDGDGVPDGCDSCPDADDQVDSDQDGVPDGCDICPGSRDAVDTDGDGMPDGCDQCPGADDRSDTDGDGVPDGCDLCPGSPDTIDSDQDGVPDGCDLCPGADDQLDADQDGVPDGCDLCANADDLEDADGDGVPDACDSCPGADDSIDVDQDGIPDGCKDCIGQPDSICGFTHLNTQALSRPALIEAAKERNKIIRKVDEELIIQIAPNPFHEFVRIRLLAPVPEMKRAIIRVLDINGRLIFERYDVPFGENITILPHAGWNKGTYIIQIRAGAYSAIRRIIRQ